MLKYLYSKAVYELSNPILIAIRILFRALFFIIGYIFVLIAPKNIGWFILAFAAYDLVEAGRYYLFTLAEKKARKYNPRGHRAPTTEPPCAQPFDLDAYIKQHQNPQDN